MATPVYSILEVVDKLGLEYTTRGNITCPFCSEPSRRKTLHLNAEKDYWRCSKCTSAGGVLHFYSKYALGYDLPSSAEGKSKVAKQLRDFMGSPAVEAIDRKKPQKKLPSVPVASDDKLNEVYSAMLNLPALQLTAAHKKDLIQRGLPEHIIEKNQYRSIPDNYQIPDIYTVMYEEAGGETLKESILDRYPSYKIRFGLMIAHQLITAGCDLQGVPGFFKFGDKWCFWFVPGIMIPTRNTKGQIVIWQVRQKRSPKYLTLSCGSLPGAVTDQVSRCHIPLGNAPLSNKVPIIYTEGPLKGDIACYLYGKSVSFLAIPGINTTKDLLRVLAEYRNLGITDVYNALDMDRLTNPNVRKGSAKLKTDIQNLGISVTDLFWGIHYARSKYNVLKTVAKIRHVPVPKAASNTIFDQLDALSEALDNAGVRIYQAKDASKENLAYNWDSETKGIDDFLLHNAGLDII